MPPTITETINEALLLDVLAIYTDAEDKMLKLVAKRVAKGIKTEGWNEKKLNDTQALKSEIEKVLNDTSKKSKAKVSQGIIEAYKKGMENVDTSKGTHETILDELDIPMNLKMQILATNNLLDNASFQVLRKASDAYQQVMAQATTGLLAGTDTRIQASQKMLNNFAAKGITSFVDKAGRNWDLSSYAEMCARTVSAHAALQGHVDRQIEVGEDLVKVSTIGTTCPICQRWQGVVLSISGNSPKYHSLEEAKSSGLFHPNCKHTMVMHIPELDGEGKIEPNPVGSNKKSDERYILTQQQRANERKIRYWKKRKALAITPEEQLKCDQMIKHWQYTNMLHCEKHGLRRLYAREGVMKGYKDGPKGAFIGGSLQEFEELYKDVIGVHPKTAFSKFKMNLQLFAEKSYTKWLKEEIQSLDQLDIDKAMMKDANNKAVTPTSLYKKYIGDNPMQDYTAISEYEKGTKEFKSGYAKWLKTQIEEIGVTYKIKPKYVTIHEDIPGEDTKLSATEIYKKYHNGEKPTEAYKALGGEEGTGMKYSKWVETQKKELIKNGITKTVPFNEATQKTADTIVQAEKTVQEVKKVVKEDVLKKYQEKLDTKVHGAYDGYLQVKEALEIFNEVYDEVESVTDEKLMIESEKVSLAMKKHLEMVKKKAEKTFGGSSFDYDLQKLEKMYDDEKDSNMKAHIKSQIDTYNEVKNEKEEAEKKAKKEKVHLQFAEIFLSEVTFDPDSHSYIEIMSELETYHLNNWKSVYDKYAETIYIKTKKDFSAPHITEEDIVAQEEFFTTSLKGAINTGNLKAQLFAEEKLKAIGKIKKDFEEKMQQDKYGISGVDPVLYADFKKKYNTYNKAANAYNEAVVYKYNSNTKKALEKIYLEQLDKHSKKWDLLTLENNISAQKTKLLNLTQGPEFMHTQKIIKVLEDNYKELGGDLNKLSQAKSQTEEGEVKLKAGKVTLGRETRFDEGKLVEREKIYQEVSLEDLEKLSKQVKGHELFANSNRRDILGRDRNDGHNHHMGHDVKLKEGLSEADQELGEAFKLAYDEYFNTVKCQPINLAYLKGYKNATPAMKKKIDAMNKCIQSVELNEPIVVHRFVDKDIIEAIFHTDDVHSLRPGSLHENNTFMSTAVGGHPTFGKRPYMITLQCDKGTHALPTLNHEELEVLLGKGKLEFVRTNSYTKSKPNKLKNFDGSYTNFVGDEVVVRYIEEGRAHEYEEVSPEKIQAMLNEQVNVDKHKREAKKWIDSLNPDEMKAQKRYTGNWYVEMNNVYRRGNRDSKEVVKYSEDLTESLRRAETKNPVVLRRGVNESDLAHMLGFNGDVSKISQYWDEVNKGGYAAEDKGFLSTSPMSEGGFHKKVELRIYCPTKTHAVYVDSISTNKGEKETLLQSGSMYRVHKLVKENGKTIAYLELLGTD